MVHYCPLTDRLSWTRMQPNKRKQTRSVAWVRSGGNSHTPNKSALQAERVCHVWFTYDVHHPTQARRDEANNYSVPNWQQRKQNKQQQQMLQEFSVLHESQSWTSKHKLRRNATDQLTYYTRCNYFWDYFPEYLLETRPCTRYALILLCNFITISSTMFTRSRLGGKKMWSSAGNTADDQREQTCQSTQYKLCYSFNSEM